jgi:cyclopropane-fatty-acyl-phospholipid synthase
MINPATKIQFSGPMQRTKTDIQLDHEGASVQEREARVASDDSVLDSSGKPTRAWREGFNRWLLGRVREQIGEAPFRIVLWNGTELRPSEARPIATVYVRDRLALAKVLVDPELQFGEAYSRGSIELEGDLVTFLEAAYAALKGRTGRRYLVRRRRNTVRGSRDNIHHHYDISNEFYKLWLDPELVYSCAYYPFSESTLEEAQIAKMHHVCRKLRITPGETVVDAGCGWGALALFMARHYGVLVRAYNISAEQISFARERARREGLADRVEFVAADYRDIEGCFDAFVSVGMLEHVGLDYYRDLGQAIHRSLKPNGRGLLHFIGRNQPAPINAWIGRRIFPGAYPPSLREALTIFEPWEFSVLDVENLRLHYAKTCRDWLTRFDCAEKQVRAIFGDEFTRAWRLYLAGSVAAFTTGSLQLFQVAFARSRDNSIPLTREWLYREASNSQDL